MLSTRGSLIQQNRALYVRKLKRLGILLSIEMSEGRGQTDPVGTVVAAITVAIVALLGIYLFSEFNQTITVTGSLSGTGEDVLVDAAEALVLAVGGSGIAVTAILILRGAGR